MPKTGKRWALIAGSDSLQGGEFSYYNRRDQKKALAENGPNGISFEQAAKQFHVSYMIGNDQPSYQPIARIKEAAKWTGYRFRVTSAFRDGSTVKLHVTNEGVAPLYRDAFFTAGKKRSRTSLRGLLPGETRACEINNVEDDDASQIAIQCDAILSSQTIQFAANLD